MWKHDRIIGPTNAWLKERVSSGERVLYRLNGELHVGIIDSGRNTRRDGWKYNVGRRDHNARYIFDSEPHNIRELVRDYEVRGIPGRNRLRLHYAERTILPDDIITIYRTTNQGHMWRRQLESGTIVCVRTYSDDRNKVVYMVDMLTHYHIGRYTHGSFDLANLMPDRRTARYTSRLAGAWGLGSIYSIHRVPDVAIHYPIEISEFRRLQGITWLPPEETLALQVDLENQVVSDSDRS